MDFSVQWIDVNKALSTGKQPSVLVQRPQAGFNDRPQNAGLYGSAKLARVGTFYVPAGPVNVKDITWTISTQGDHVRVPMEAYRTTLRSKSVLLACAAELGIRAGFSLARKTNLSPTQVMMIIGNRVDNIEGVYRYYLGLMIRVEGD